MKYLILLLVLFSLAFSPPTQSCTCPVGTPPGEECPPEEQVCPTGVELVEFTAHPKDGAFAGLTVSFAPAIVEWEGFAMAVILVFIFTFICCLARIRQS